jgi:two-component system NarL family sensor kinase
MDAATTQTETAEKRTVVRPATRAGESAATGLDVLGRAPSDQRGLADGLLRILESDRAHVAGVLGGEIVSVMTMARYLTEDATQRLGRGGDRRGVGGTAERKRVDPRRNLALCSELRPRVLDDLGVLPALAWHFRDFSHGNRAIFVSPRITVSEADIPADLKLTIFRIVQAALSNVARHSKASAVRVFLSLFENELRLGIEDNGVGFDVEHWRRHRRGQDGCGLGMIQRWAETHDGRSNIEAAPRHGARVQVFWRMREALCVASRIAGIKGAVPPAAAPSQ